MARISFKQFRTVFALIVLSSFLISCSTQATGRYYGVTKAPEGQVLRYISGSEPESLDPQVPTGQPEARLLMALYDGLVEYDPKTMDPIPAIAESWETSPDGTEFIFHLRKNATFSNGAPITAKDFVYTFRRGLSPELAAQNAYLAYYIKYGEAYNSGKAFVKRPDGSFVLESDLEEKKPAENVKKETVTETTAVPTEKPGQPVEKPLETEKQASSEKSSGTDTEFHRYITRPMRLTVPGDEKSRAEAFEKDPKLKALVAGAEFVPVTGEDIGVEAVDDYTFRITLYQPAPFFLGLLGHQFFRVVHQPTIEKFGIDWTRPENIVTSGAFRLVERRPYDQVIVEKDPNYWDAENVRLQRIEFYPMEEATTMMNLYKAGYVDALYNHTPPADWNEVISQYKDEYLNFPEVAIEYYTFSVNKGPMKDLKIREAFALAVDREALAKYRKTTKPLVDFTPEGIFPKYEIARQKVYSEKLKQQGSSMEEWKARIFNPEKARQLLAEAGYPVQKNGDRYSCPTFPAGEISLTYNTAESNKNVAEFIQAQWKQNLGIEVPLRNMEWKTFLTVRKKVEYTGMARAGWVGDYMDPYTFLNLFYSENNDSSTGWHNPKFDRMLDEANKEQDPMKRLEKLAEAEFLLMQDQPVIPLQTQATNWIKKPYVKGMYPNPGTLHAWKFVYIEHDPAKWDQNVDNIMKDKDPWVEEQVARLMKTQEDFTNAKKAKETNTATAE
jgi:oligopeptide transport system substrate-binding protein